MRRITSLVTVGVLVFLASGLAGAAEQGWSYRIGPRDLVDIQVFEVPELNVERRVSAGGTVGLPLVGDVQVQGLTVSELELKLQTLLESRYVQRASVSVEIKEYRSKPIMVIGAVNSPGPLAFSGRWTLLEALAAAGGMTQNRGQEVYVLRRAPNGMTDQLTVNLDQLLAGEARQFNVPLVANDLVHVPVPVSVTVFCLGELNSPGALSFQSTDRITVLTAVARAGGLTDRASDKILIKRRNRTGQDEQLEVDYGDIVSGDSPDVELEPNDILVVKESFF